MTIINAMNIGRYVLDRNRGCLLSDGREIPLRAPAFAILTYLAERPGQAVPREDLFEAGWPGLIVDGDLLEQSIGELRRALADSEGRLITAEQNRGYQLNPDAAPPERRHARGVTVLRWRWKYGLLAALAPLVAFAVIWLATSRGISPKPMVDTRPAIAILPFHNQSQDPADVGFADGFTRELIQVVARDPALVVKSWPEVEVYKGALAQPGEIARVLAVRYQLEGSLRLAGDRLQVSAQLVDVQGSVLWSARYDEPAADMQAVRSRIATEITSALGASAESREP